LFREVDATVALDEMHLIDLEEAKISASSADHPRIELDDVDLHTRHGAAEIGRDRASAEPDHENASDFLRIERRRRHQSCIGHLQIVWVVEVNN
jgi:hypothetical protein